MPSATENKMENVLNPFYEDTKPSFSIYLKSVKDESETYKWCFNDFGDESYFGDVFDFASFYYDLDIKQDFNEIVSNIIRDLNINDVEVTKSDICLSSDMQNFGFELIYYNQADQKEITQNYFLSNYSIPYSVCLEYGVKAIKGYKHLKGEKITSFSVRANEVLIAYSNDGYSKLYLILINMAAVFYLLIGLFFLNLILEGYYINEWEKSLILFASVFATNLFYYTVVESGMSHIYSFAFISKNGKTVGYSSNLP